MYKKYPSPKLGLTLFVGDILALLVTYALAFMLRLLFGGFMPFGVYINALPFLALIPLLYLAMGLYPGLLPSPPDELKKLSTATSLGYLILLSSFFMIKDVSQYSRITLALAWALALIAVPLTRAYIRKHYCRNKWWGYPTALFGSKKNTATLWHLLRRNPGLGLTPSFRIGPDLIPYDARIETSILDEEQPPQEVAFWTDTSWNTASHDLHKRLLTSGKNEHTVALLVLASDDQPLLQKAMVDFVSQHFKQAIIIPSLPWNSYLCTKRTDVAGLFGLFTHQNLLDKRRIAFKRCVDLCITILAGIVLLPFILLLALGVKLDSKGPAFFRHTRLGYKGREIRVLKFRTMCQNGQEVLDTYLAKHPDQKAEWEADHKLRNDPRVTKIGKFLRKTSLDELPQLWNVLWGEMSLVGPRPIVHAEIAKYEDAYTSHYVKVAPGITGLWQISGRNNTGYAERVGLDKYYTANWSIWLDIYILACTPGAVLRQDGAY